MPGPSDIVVIGTDGQLKALVEVTGKPQATKSWASQLRRNRFAHSTLPQTPFFLLVSPSSMFLWSNLQNPNDLVEPTVELQVGDLFGKSWKEIQSRKIYESSVALAASAWLNQLASGYIGDGPEYEELRDTGFVDAVSGGRVEMWDIQ
jgi:hypothetical protein